MCFQVSEAIQLGARAIKENHMNVKEVELCLQELDEFMDSQKIIHNALGGLYYLLTALYSDSNSVY